VVSLAPVTHIICIPHAYNYLFICLADASSCCWVQRRGTCVVSPGRLTHWGSLIVICCEQEENTKKKRLNNSASSSVSTCYKSRMQKLNRGGKITRNSSFFLFLLYVFTIFKSKK
jgi:hypothetical protein